MQNISIFFVLNFVPSVLFFLQLVTNSSYVSDHLPGGSDANGHLRSFKVCGSLSAGLNRFLFF